MNTVKLLQYILYSLEVVACIAGFLSWKKIRNSYWKWFPVYLLCIVLLELTGNYLNQVKEYGIKNNIVNYISLPLEFLFFYWLYYRYSNTASSRKLVIACTLAYITGWIVDRLCFSDRNFFFNSFSYSIGNLSLLVVIIAFYIQLARSNDIVSFRSNMMFWVSLGLLVFFLGTLPYFGLFRLLYEQYKDLFRLYARIMLVCNCIMYLLFTVSFIWGKPK